MPAFDLGLLAAGQYRDWLVHGFVLSLEITAITWVLALPLAAAIALLRISPSQLLQSIGSVYVEGIRNVPLLAHLLFWYFGAPELLPEPVKLWLYAGNIESRARSSG